MGAVVNGIYFNTESPLASEGGFFDKLTGKIDKESDYRQRLREQSTTGMNGLSAADAPSSFLDTLKGALGLGGPAKVSATNGPATPIVASAPSAAPPSGASPYQNAIAGIESGGRYDITGPVTKTGDRAYGKYQVMGANIPEWSRAALGREVTPEEFLANPKIQDAVFNRKFTEYAQKYGPEGAAKAWFAGEGGMDNPNVRDQLGTSVAAYAEKFNRGLPAGGTQAIDGAAPTQVAANVAPASPVAAPASAATPPVAPAAVAAPQAAATAAPNEGVPLAQIQAMLRSRDPDTYKMGLALFQQSVSPKEGFTLGENQIRYNTRGQEIARGPAKNDAPTQVKEWLVARSQGDQRPFAKYQEDLKAAGASKTNVSVDQKAQTAEETERGKGLASRFNTIVEDGGKASEDAVVYSQLGALLKSVETGGWTNFAERVRQATGGALVLDKNTDNVQALNALVNYVAPRLRVPGSGAQSDKELANFQASITSLAGSPGGNEKILNTLAGIVEYRKQRADIAAQWQTGDISGKEAQKRLDALPSPFNTKGARAPEAKPPLPDARKAGDGNWYVPDPARPGKYLRVEP